MTAGITLQLRVFTRAIITILMLTATQRLQYPEGKRALLYVSSPILHQVGKKKDVIQFGAQACQINPTGKLSVNLI